MQKNGMKSVLVYPMVAWVTVGEEKVGVVGSNGDGPTFVESRIHQACSLGVDGGVSW